MALYPDVILSGYPQGFPNFVHNDYAHKIHISVARRDESNPKPQMQYIAIGEAQEILSFL